MTRAHKCRARGRCGGIDPVGKCSAYVQLYMRDICLAEFRAKQSDTAMVIIDKEASCIGMR